MFLSASQDYPLRKGLEPNDPYLRFMHGLGYANEELMAVKKIARRIPHLGSKLVGLKMEQPSAMEYLTSEACYVISSMRQKTYLNFVWEGNR